MPAAARMGDLTNHPGAIAGPGVATVLIGGLAAAVVGDLCEAKPPGMIAKGSATVFIGGRPAARMGDPAGAGAQIVSGMPTVEIGG